ncbi:UDP-glucose 6-dehydrogenase [Solemya pervernicosa gill symbiont]|uniref:UDP-glucose 6-dehydrogenase n=2 Tax=Gammaproteobacteria incertae sedis TaxID=118884 RepID=A0A1T2KZ70_9GAMM|nr:UDP-glucose/GDP-mannose dehydrogenase family protein [Candidatus Reidiella endopervernicosa]OOZ38060.1 UDP-glucose 6-dehydrogenase [Solemya pervernicosa gill symbiont]QKQ26066.1 UDP-glucose/GDP-mannose dehydrogenase family protein [Candidatus Reidiella endopervernicosa]
MKVTIYGSGYVGLVTGACLAQVGNDVLCVDIDPRKIDMLNNDEIPIYEPGLEDIVRSNRLAGRLNFTLDVQKGVDHGLFQFIAVGTPPDEDGSADLQHVLAVAKSIGEHIDEHKVVINKSTVPVGTADKVRAQIEEVLASRSVDAEFDVVSNPEFLKEGAAIEDFMRPDRIVIGTDNHRATELLRTLYAPFNRSHDRLVEMDIRSAELTKYASNAMLATKISFMNELANLAEQLGADIENVRIGMGSDPRIGYHFIYPGAGYGGSCFPKDVQALERTADQIGYNAELLRSVEAVNYRQKQRLFQKIETHFKGDLAGKSFALWGLSFKPNTDDMREAPSRVLMEALWAAGAKVQAFDPEAMEETSRIYGERNDLKLCEDHDEALQGADALVVVTEWNLFRSPDMDKIKSALSEPTVFDGRNLYDPQTMNELGFEYYAIGRGK